MNNKNIEFIVHVGAGKTGSTSIQSYFKSNFERLKLNSTLYAGLVFETLGVDKEWKKNQWVFNENLPSDILIKEADKYAEFAKKSNISRIVISNESFCNKIELLVPFLLYLKTKYTLKIVYYVRDLYKWSVSAYKQWNIKHKTYQGEICSFDTFLKTKPYSLLYSVVKELQCSGFENELIIRNFDKLEKQDVTFDFLSAIGIDAKVGVRSNEGLSVYDLPVFYFYNNSKNEPVLPIEGEEIIKKVNSYTILSNEYLSKVKFDVKLNEVECELKLVTNKINKYLDKKEQLNKKPSQVNDMPPSVEYLNMTQFAIDNYSKLRLFDGVKLRDAAILLEDKDLRLSHALMSFASILRPSGKFIKEKLAEYECRLKAEG